MGRQRSILCARLGEMESGPHQWLLCFDFDGTFIDQADPESVDPGLVTALEKLRQQGAAVAINTGRSLFQAVTGINACRLRDTPDFLVAWERELYQPTRFRRWVDLGDWNKRCRKEHKKLFRARRRLLRKFRDFVTNHSGARWIEEPDEPAGIIARDDPEMDHIVAYIDHEIMRAEAHQLAYERNHIYLRFAHSRYNKGTALAELAQMLDVPRERVFAIGDNHNDLSMLNDGIAGMLACPANAVDEVKKTVAELGGHVSRQPAGSGAADALAHFFNLDQ